jgi:UDP-3-O-[3-hydroxymyristoyl] glucosamine N-acyltransferase
MAGRVPIRLGKLAEALGAVLEGDPERTVSGVAPLQTAGPDDVAFVSDVRHLEAARVSRAGAFLTPSEATGLPGAVLRCAAPRLTLIDLLGLFHPSDALVPGIDPSAVVSREALVDPTAAVGALAVVEAGAVIGPRVRLHPFVYVGPGAQIGEECVLYPHVTVRDGVRLGRRVIVHPGAVLGADGFGYQFDGAVHRKVPQVGGVIVEDDVEIGANTTIDRSTLGDTIVHRGTKIDNLVMIAHNVEIGEDAILAAQVGIAGSCHIGRGVVLTGQVGVADHVTIGAGAIALAQTGIAFDVPAGEKVMGYPARPTNLGWRIVVAERQLPDLVRRVRQLERRIEELESRLGDTGTAPRG